METIQEKGRPNSMKRAYFREGKVLNIETPDKMADVAQDRRKWMVYAICDAFGTRAEEDRKKRINPDSPS